MSTRRLLEPCKEPGRKRERGVYTKQSFTTVEMEVLYKYEVVKSDGRDTRRYSTGGRERTH